MEQQRQEETKQAETTVKMEYAPPKTTKHDPVEIVGQTPTSLCIYGTECSLYYYY